MRKKFFSFITALFCIGSMMTVQADTWTPAGTPASVFTNEWTPNTPANDMTLINGLYTFVKGVTYCGPIQFKVCHDHTWTTAYPGNNYSYTIPGGAKYLIITYNTSGNAVNAYSISSMTVAGGSTALFGAEWAPEYAANDMTLDGGVYKFEKEHVTLSAGTIEFKAVSDHKWGHEWPSSNYQLSIPESGDYTITITFDPATLAVNATATLEQAVVVIPTVQLHSNIKNADWESADFTTDEGDETASLTLTNVAAGNYSFGIKIDGNWTSNGSVITRENASAEIVSGSGDCSFTADIPGNYTFTWRYADNTLSIGYPDKVEYVEGLIAAIGEVTVESASAINAARTAYDNLLSDAQQTQVSNYNVLETAEATYAALFNQQVADEVIALINAIPNPVVYTEACYNAILAARTQYNGLTVAQKELVTNYSVLTDAEAAYNALIRYTVAGMPSALFGTEWDPENTANDMTLQPNGTYLWEKEGAELAEGSVAFKVCKDHAWTISYPNSNYVLAIPEDGIYTITITFNPAAEGDKVSGVATKTGDAVIAHTAQMKGIWDDWTDAVDYVDNGDGTATVSKRFAATGDYTFKVIIDGGWRGESNTFARDNNEIEGIVDNTGDMTLTVDVPGCYTFTWNFESNKLTIAYPSLTIDVAAIVNNQTGTLVEPAEQIQGTELHFGVAPDGSRVAADDPTAVLFVDGQYHSEHGMVTPTFTVMVPGSVDIYVGKCTYSTKTINVRNAANYIVASKTPTAACWKNDRANMTVLHYEGVATTLTISGMDFCPYIRVKTAPALDPLPEYINVKAQVNNQTGTDLTNDEMAAQGNAVSFGMNAANERVAVDAANAILLVNGNYHSDHGMTNAVFTVRVPGNVDIYVGECTYSSKTINVKDEDNNLVASLTPETVCWKNNHNNLAVLHYIGEANTLTISGMDFCPYICVKSTPAEVPSEIDIPAIVNNQEGTLLENSELVQNTPVNFGVAADGSRVPADHPNAILYVDGKYNNEHGLKNPIFTVRVPGEVEIYVGECTYSTATIEVRNAANELVDSKTPEAVCWKNDHNNLAVLHYTGEATTLTISGMQYCPFIRVKTPTVPVYTEVRSGLEINRYYTICLPQAFTEAQGASFWTLRYRNNSSTEVYLEEETAPFEAGKPYIFQATAETLEVMYEGEPVSTPVENGALRGTLVDLSESELAAKGTNIYLLIQNALRPITSGNYLNANRAYIDFDALQAVSTAPAAAPGRRVRNMPMQGQVATGVDALHVSDQPTKMVIDGQLIIRRGEKLYDATGRVVK